MKNIVVRLFLVPLLAMGITFNLIGMDVAPQQKTLACLETHPYKGSYTKQMLCATLLYEALCTKNLPLIKEIIESKLVHHNQYLIAYTVKVDGIDTPLTDDRVLKNYHTYKSMNLVSTLSYLPLECAILRKDAELVKFLVETCKVNVNITSNWGRSLVHEAIVKCDVEIARHLLAHCDPNCLEYPKNPKDANNRTPMQLVNSLIDLWHKRQNDGHDPKIEQLENLSKIAEIITQKSNTSQSTARGSSSASSSTSSSSSSSSSSNSSSHQRLSSSSTNDQSSKNPHVQNSQKYHDQNSSSAAYRPKVLNSDSDNSDSDTDDDSLNNLSFKQQPHTGTQDNPAGNSSITSDQPTVTSSTPTSPYNTRRTHDDTRTTKQSFPIPIKELGFDDSSDSDTDDSSDSDTDDDSLNIFSFKQQPHTGTQDNPAGNSSITSGQPTVTSSTPASPDDTSRTHDDTRTTKKSFSIPLKAFGFAGIIAICGFGIKWFYDRWTVGQDVDEDEETEPTDASIDSTPLSQA